MKEFKNILIDLRGCQQWRDRGIPRYIQSLTFQLIQDHPELSFYFLYEKGRAFPTKHESLVEKGTILFEDGSSYLPHQKKPEKFDIYFLTWLFVPPQNKSVAEYLLPFWVLESDPVLLGLIYDFIPLIYSETYLPSADHRGQYQSCLEIMKRCDHLFAISQCTKDDATRLAGIAPHKVTNIYGSIDEEKWAKAKQKGIEVPSHQPLSFSFGNLLSKNYYIYIAGDDFRKNLAGLIQAQALLKKRSSSVVPVVITCTMTPESRQSWYEFGKVRGLVPDQDLFVTGHVSDTELISMMSHAKASLFPSFYEGLGLPILESYELGVPVLGSDSSSIGELIHPRCGFDPKSPESIAQAVQRFEKDYNELHQVSLEFGKAVLKKCRWSESSKCVSKVLVDLSSKTRQKEARSLATGKGTTRKEKVAFFGCLPPSQTGIANFSFESLKTAPFPVHFFTSFDHAKDLKTRTLDLKGTPHLILNDRHLQLSENFFSYKKRLFALGNSGHHRATLDALFKASELPDKYIYLHEAQLISLWNSYFGGQFSSVKAFYQVYYPECSSLIQKINLPHELVESRLWGVRPLLLTTKPKKFIVNSRYCRDLLIEDGVPPEKIEVCFHPIFEKNSSLSQNLAFDAKPKGLRVGHFGILDIEKSPGLFIQAMEIVNKQIPGANLVLAGYGVREWLGRHGSLNPKRYPFIQILDSPSDSELQSAMASVDLAIQLRRSSHGESSGCLSQLLALEKKVIVSDVGSFKDYGDAVILVDPQIPQSELADIIISALKNGPEMTAAIRKVVKKYSVNNFHNRLMEILQLS